MVGEEHTIVGPYVFKHPSRAHRTFTSSTGVYSDGPKLYTASAPDASCMIAGM